MSVLQRICEDTRAFIRLSQRAYLVKWPLDERFNLVASRLQAEPLGFCLLKPNIEYPILQIGRWYDDVMVNVSLGNQLYSYRLPKAYSEMILLDDISNINTGRTRYALVRVETRCGRWRLPFDHKNYTWDLQLRSI